MSVCLSVCMHVCMHACMYVCIYRESETAGGGATSSFSRLVAPPGAAADGRATLSTIMMLFWLPCVCVCDARDWVRNKPPQHDTPTYLPNPYRPHAAATHRSPSSLA